MESSDSNSVIHLTHLVIDAPGLSSADSQTVTEEERRETSLDSECCRVKGFFESCQEAEVSEGGPSVDRQSSDLQVAEVDTTSHHVKYMPEVEDITNDSVDIYENLETKGHSLQEREGTLTQANDNADVSHELFNENAMDLSLVEDSLPPGPHKYLSSFGMNLKTGTNTSTKSSPSHMHSDPLDEQINQKSGIDFLSPVTPTTSKARNICCSSSPHSKCTARTIVPMTSPLKSAGWNDVFRSPIRSPKIRRMIRQKVKKASIKDDMNSSRRESLSDSEVEDVNESSRLSALDLYTDVLEDSVQGNYQEEIRKLQGQITQQSNKLEGMNITTSALREQLKLTQEESEKVKAENAVLRMNMSRLMKTAQLEMRSKRREILALELRLKNGGNEELLRRVIPYQPYTGKSSSSLKDNPLKAGNIQNNRWNKTALGIMKEVKDAVYEIADNTSKGFISNTASDIITQRPVEAAINDKNQSCDSVSKYRRTPSAEVMWEEKRIESERKDWERRRTSLCEERERVSRGNDRRTLDNQSKSAALGNCEKEIPYEGEIVDRTRRRYSRSSSCEKSSREREPGSHDKNRKSCDFTSNLAREKEKEGSCEQDKRDQRRRISRSNSCEKASREPEEVLHGKNKKSHDLPPNLEMEGKFQKEKEGRSYEHEKKDRRRRISRSSSCEKSSTERESASYGKDRKSHDLPSNLRKEEKILKKENEANCDKDKSCRRSRISRSSSCEKSSRERGSSHGKDKDKKSHDFGSSLARNEKKQKEKEGNYEHEKWNQRKSRTSRSCSCEKSSKERDTGSNSKNIKSHELPSNLAKEERSHKKVEEGNYEKGKRDRGRRNSRSSSCEKSSREKESSSHGKNGVSLDFPSNLTMEEKRQKKKEGSYELEKRDGRKTSRSSSCEKSLKGKESASHGKDGKSHDLPSNLTSREEALKKWEERKSKKEERGRKIGTLRSSSRENSSREREPELQGKDRKSHDLPSNLTREEKTLKEKDRRSEHEKKDRRRRISRSSSCEKKSRETGSSDEKDKMSHDFPSNLNRKEKIQKEKEGSYEHEGKDRKSHNPPSNLRREEKIATKGEERHYEIENCRRRISRSSSCEETSRERGSSHCKDGKSPDLLTNLARKGKGYDHEERDRLDKGKRRQRRTSSSSSCEKLSKGRKLISGESERELHDYPSRSARRGRRDEDDDSDVGRRRHSKSSSSRERESTSHDKSNKLKKEKRIELEKGANQKTRKYEKRRRYSRSSSCEKCSRERVSVSPKEDVERVEPKKGERAKMDRKQKYSPKEKERVSSEKGTSEEKRDACKKDENHERAKRVIKRRYSRSSSCEKLPEGTKSKFHEKEKYLDGDQLKPVSREGEGWKTKSGVYMRREQERGNRYSRSRSLDKASVERNVKSDDEVHTSDDDGDDDDDNSAKESTRGRKNSRSSSCERSSEYHERDSEDHSASSSSRSKKHDDAQLFKRSLEAEGRSRSGSRERRKVIHTKDSATIDLYSELGRKAKESEKIAASKERTNYASDSEKHRCDEKDVRINNGEESSDENDDVRSRESKKFVKEDYKERVNSYKKRGSPDGIPESSKAEELSYHFEFGKASEEKDKKCENRRRKNKLKSVSPELSSKRRKVTPPTGDSDEVFIGSGDHPQNNARSRKTGKSTEIKTKSSRKGKELKSSSNEWQLEKSPRKEKTHSSKYEAETKVSKIKTFEVPSEVRDKRKSRAHGKRSDRKSDHVSDSEESEKELLEQADGGQKNETEKIQGNDLEESYEGDTEIDPEEFELVKSVGIEVKESSENIDNAGKDKSKIEELEMDEIEAEMRVNGNSDQKGDKEVNAEMGQLGSKETLKRKRDENTLENRSDSVGKSSCDATEMRKTRRKHEHFKMECKDSISEKLFKKKSDVPRSHSDSRLSEKLDCNKRRGLKKKTKASKLKSKGNPKYERLCERDEENGSYVSKSNGDAIKSPERDIRTCDGENKLHDQLGSSSDLNFDQGVEKEKPLKVRKKKPCKTKVKSCKDRDTPSGIVEGLCEENEKSDDVQYEIVSNISKKQEKFRENEISSQSFCEPRKDSSSEAMEMGEKKEQNLEMLRDKGSDKNEKKKSNSRSSSDECFSIKKQSPQQETILRVEEHPLISNNSDKCTSNSRLLSDLQMSSDTGDDISKVHLFDELSLFCEGQVFFSSDGEHQEVESKDGQQKLLSFSGKFQNDDQIESCEEKVTEEGSVNVQQENLSKTSHKDDLTSVNCSSNQNSAKEASENEGVLVEEVHLEVNSASENDSENKFRCKRKMEEGAEISKTSSQEGVSIDVISQNSCEKTSGQDKKDAFQYSHEKTSGEYREITHEKEYDLNENSKETSQKRDTVSTSTTVQINKTEDILPDVLDSSKKRDSDLNDSSLLSKGEVSRQDRDITDYLQADGNLCTPAKGPFTFEEGHTVISCGKPFTKIVGSIPAEETEREEVKVGTVQQGDAIKVYVSDSSLTDPFSPDKCKKDLFKDKRGKPKLLTAEKVKRKVSSTIVVSSKSEKSSKSRSSPSKKKLEDQDVLRKRIVSRYPGRERSVSQMRPVSSKRELAKKYLQRAKHVQRSKPHDSLIKDSPERKRHSHDLRNLILKQDRIKCESRYRREDSRNRTYYIFDPLTSQPQNRWQRRKAKSLREELASKDHPEDRKRDKKSSTSKDRSHKNLEKVAGDGNGVLNTKSSSKEKQGKHSDCKGERKTESGTEQKKEVRPIKEVDTSLSDGEIRSDSDDSGEDDKIVESRTERHRSSDRDENRTRKSSRHSSSRRTSRRR